MTGMSTKMSKQTPVDRPYINAFESGSFKVSGRTFNGPVLLLPDRIEPLAPSSVGAITASDLQPVIDTDPPVEVLLIGTGDRFATLPHALRATLKQKGVSVESMATRSACLTYNLIAGEGRRVAAALLPVG